MPQFELANFLPQIAWLIFAFAILYFVIVRATLPRLGRVMVQRDHKVTGDIDAAASAKAHADEVAAAYAAELHKAQEAARAMLADSRSDAQKGVEARLAEADKKMAGQIQVAQTALNAAKDKASAGIEAIAADAAADIVARITGARPTGAKAKSAAASALAKV